MNSNSNNIASTETEGWTWMAYRNRDTKELTCPICPEPLSFPSEKRFQFLFTHWKEVHNLSEPPTCRLCHVIFSTADLRLKHIEDLHKVCPICSREFTHSRGLNRHQKFAHGSVLSDLACPICFVELEKKKNLNRHLKRVHSSNSTLGVTAEILPKKPKTTVICLTCSREFKEKEHLNNHVKRVHNPKSTPNVSIEIAREKARRDLTCSTCSMKYETWTKLYNHGKRAHNPKSTQTIANRVQSKTTGQSAKPN